MKKRKSSHSSLISLFFSYYFRLYISFWRSLIINQIVCWDEGSRSRKKFKAIKLMIDWMSFKNERRNWNYNKCIYTFLLFHVSPLSHFSFNFTYFHLYLRDFFYCSAFYLQFILRFAHSCRSISFHLRRFANLLRFAELGIYQR